MEPINIKRTNNNNNQQNFTMYSLSKRDYDKFVAKMEKSEFKNAYTRYLSERSLLLTMLKYAKEENLEKETSQIIARLEEVDKNLDEKGIKLPIEYK